MGSQEIIDIVKLNIDFYIDKFGWTRNELANRTSVSASTISEWYKKENVMPSLKNLLEISDAFGISLGRLAAKNNQENMENRELELLKHFSRFNAEEQETLLQTLRILSKNKE